MSIIKQGKKKRNELELPTMHFIVADDWLDKLGPSFNVWLKLHTFVDRTDGQREYDRVPMSLENLYEKRLKMSKSKFYRIIKPLWEYGLIDIIEYEKSARESQKPKNIIVYEYPLHIVERKYMPLEKLRDWSKDYDSTSKDFGKTGGRPKNVIPIVAVKKQKYRLNKVHGFKNETVTYYRFKNETVDGFKNETVTVSKMKPNNVLNYSNNSSNSFTNGSNSSSSSSFHQGQKEEDLKNDDDIFFMHLREFLKANSLCPTNKKFEQVKERLRENGVAQFKAHHIQAAYDKTINRIYTQNDVDQPHLYFVTILENEITNGVLRGIKQNDIDKKKKEREAAKKVEFYNWLEERQ